MLAAFLGGAAILVRPELWLIEHIVFEGARHATRAELRHLANLPNGTPIWAVVTPAVEQSIERHPWVERAHVEVIWPNTVRVRIEEHEPVALLWERNRLVYVDRNGTTFRAASPDDLDYPHLTGFTGNDHPELQVVAVRSALALLDQLAERQRVRRGDVSEVAFSPSAGFTVYVGPARILFAPERFAEQLDRLDRLVAAGVDLRAPVEIDLAPAKVAIVRDLSSPPLADSGG